MRSNVKKCLFNYKKGGLGTNYVATYNKRFYTDNNINFNIN